MVEEGLEGEESKRHSAFLSAWQRSLAAMFPTMLVRPRFLWFRV